MPEVCHFKIRPAATCRDRRTTRATVAYAELQATSNFSFLRGGSHPEELIERAAELGYHAIAITDLNSVAGVVRAHTAAKDLQLPYIVGSRLEISYEPVFTNRETRPRCEVLVYPYTREGYGNLCRLLSLGKLRAPTGRCVLTFEDLFEYQRGMILTMIPPGSLHSLIYHAPQDDLEGVAWGKALVDGWRERALISIATTRNYSHQNIRFSEAVQQLASYLALPLVATNDVHYHLPSRRPLQDVLTCIRHGCTIQKAGFRLFHNAERHLKAPEEMARLFRDIPRALQRSIEIAELCRGFSLDQLRYEYPDEICPEGISPAEYLKRLAWEGAAERYPEGIPEKVCVLLREELRLIGELQYEKYFLTCHDIVRFARSIGILCQGRGAAANSAVCYCLGITSVNPAFIDTLFARFVSKERNEPPDIDIDFEHERREEVIQYIYEKYGRERAGLTCEVITYRHRSAVRDVGKALGLSLQVVERLTHAIHRWTDCGIAAEDLQEAGLSPVDPTIQLTIQLASQLLGFPRHLSQHVGGFIVTQHRLTETVPILNAGMPDRTIIEWDKDDIEALGMLKIDVLALGMLTCIRKALAEIRRLHPTDEPITLATIPPEDPTVYDMICRADTVGVFQIESRAQMSMLPRLRPRCFYDLVVEVAIVRPGPIQGDMVHPYLRRRAGLERMEFPDERVREILGKTFGVPIFQEQAMRLAIVLAQFSPGEAEQLRRAIGAWKRDKGLIKKFNDRVVQGMLASGYSEQFAETCMNQIKGFSEYGFPESHAASFALLVYASAWLKCHHPVVFAQALLNSQPMGFYSPSQILSDLRQHRGIVHPIDIHRSRWDCTLEGSSDRPELRLGFRLAKDIGEERGRAIAEVVERQGPFSSIVELWAALVECAPFVPRATLEALARADAFGSLGLSRREALWQVQQLVEHPRPLERLLARYERTQKVHLPLVSKQQEMFADYRATGFSLRAHPIGMVRKELATRRVSRVCDLHGLGRDIAVQFHSGRTWQEGQERSPQWVQVAGIGIVRQRPGTAKGTVFMTLEDETGVVNLIIRPKVFERYHRCIISSSCLLARGVLERLGEVLYVQTVHLESIDALVMRGDAAALPNRSYSY